MSGWIAFCRQGHEVQRVNSGDLPELKIKVCKQCGSNEIEFFSEVEVENYLEKASVMQTVICQNLSTKHQYSEIIPVYDVRPLFACREQDRSSTKIKFKKRHTR